MANFRMKPRKCCNLLQPARLAGYHFNFHSHNNSVENLQKIWIASMTMGSSQISLLILSEFNPFMHVVNWPNIL